MSEATTETVPTPPAVELLGIVCTPSTFPGDFAECIEGALGWCRLTSWHDDDGYCVVLTITDGGSFAGIAHTRELAASRALDDALRTLDALSRHSTELHRMPRP